MIRSHDPRLHRLLDVLPSPIQRTYAWLIESGHWWARWPLGLLFVAGGFLWFLPILGLWMLPLGLLLLGQDIPPLHRATLWLLGTVQSWWDRRRSHRAKRD